MITPAKERMRKSRAHRRLGLRPVQVLVTEREIDFLLMRTQIFHSNLRPPKPAGGLEYDEPIELARCRYCVPIPKRSASP
jgi:hypothetical protein